MNAQDLCFLSAWELAGLIGRGEVSALEATDAYLQRIEDCDGQLHSYITVTAERARQQARQADRRRAQADPAPMLGVPYGLKDMFETEGVLTTAHSRVLQHHIPTRDAQVVRRLEQAGAVLLGKQASHEFAHGGPSFDLPWPPARNPWNTAHYTGSSSTGSAAAVAGGLCSFALGTDTGGSVRTPAWMCGIVGFKPTFGLVGRSGVIGFSSSCDHVGPLTRSVADAAWVMQTIAGPDPDDPGCSQHGAGSITRPSRTELKGLRLAVIRHHWQEDLRVHPELQQAVDQAIEVMRDLGAQIEEIRLRPLTDYYAVRILLTESELFARHQHHLREHAGDYGDHFLGRTLAAALFTSSDYLSAQRQRRQMIQELEPFRQRFDAFILAGSGPAPPMDAHRKIGAQQKWSSPSMGTLCSVTGQPALALPCGFSASGLPLGLQIAGHPYGDAMVLEIGHAYEQATAWHKRRPQLEPGATAPPVDTTHEAPQVQADADMEAQVAAAVRHAGLRLNDHQFALLMESAPYAMAMARRVQRDLPWSDEPAAVFCSESIYR